MLRFLAGEDGPMAVATVIESKGSAPRRAGAKMAVRPDGTTVGTIGGGDVEWKTTQEALQIIGTGRYRMIDIDMTSDPADCGGTMKILLEDRI